jgi:DNA invertase Pin-like site-specific DNA recombinase/DNA-binding HxlR family transcriptional regulator
MHDGSASARSKNASASVALYLRVSTEEQRERQSIDTQREFGSRYTDLHKLRVHQVYADDGISGTVPLEKRPDGQRILQAARRGEFNQLLIYKLDRLCRDTRLILNAVAELEKLGVRVRSMTEEFDTASATGRLMLTMLSGFAAHERDQIRERSMAGTDRLARAGAWLGGIVPYGCAKEGEKNEARIVLSEDEIPGVGISEAEVIRQIYRMAANERATCVRIADFLNILRVPCAYARDGRLLLRGKRKQKTSGLWRAGRIRNMLINSTYMGRHEYGKRSKTPRATIVREVPAIVDEATWQKAQQVLKSHFLFGIRSTKHLYLLRGMAKCGLCGLTYIWHPHHPAKGESRFILPLQRKARHPRDLRCRGEALPGEGRERHLPRRGHLERHRGLPAESRRGGRGPPAEDRCPHHRSPARVRPPEPQDCAGDQSRRTRQGARTLPQGAHRRSCTRRSVGGDPGGLGARRFADFEANLDISKNILSARLKHLVAQGVLAPVDAGVHGTRYEYALTPMGKDLTTVMTALLQWGDRWIYGEGRKPLLMIDRRTGRRIPRLRLLDEEGCPLALRDIALAPGPGANKRTRARYRAT